MNARRSFVPRTALALVTSCLLLAAFPSAQVFRAGVDTVLLSVTVADSKSHPTAGLTQANFKVFEDGQPQNIDFFAVERLPIALSLLVDSSQSMEGKLAMAQAAATGFVQSLGPDDLAQVIDFNKDTRIRQTFTSDREALERAIGAIRVGGSTSLYTALYIALSELERHRAGSPAELRRQAIIVLSDGEDTSSLKTYDDVEESTKRSNVAVYAIGLREKLPSAGRFNEADFALRTLSQVTGGRVFFVDDVKQLPEVYGQIADELANQYVIGYNPRNTKRDGAWRQIVVRVDRPETVVRTRAGYFGPTRER
jgi:Ca-activated chloride channel family protein